MTRSRCRDPAVAVPASITPHAAQAKTLHTGRTIGHRKVTVDFMQRLPTPEEMDQVVGRPTPSQPLFTFTSATAAIDLPPRATPPRSPGNVAQSAGSGEGSFRGSDGGDNSSLAKLSIMAKEFKPKPSLRPTAKEFVPPIAALKVTAKEFVPTLRANSDAGSRYVSIVEHVHVLDSGHQLTYELCTCGTDGSRRFKHLHWFGVRAQVYSGQQQLSASQAILCCAIPVLKSKRTTCTAAIAGQRYWLS